MYDLDTYEIAEAIDKTVKGVSTSAWRGSGFASGRVYAYRSVVFEKYGSDVHARHLAHPARLRTFECEYGSYDGVFSVTIGGGSMFIKYSCAHSCDEINVFDLEQDVLGFVLHKVTGMRTEMEYPEWMRPANPSDCEGEYRDKRAVLRYILGTLHGFSFLRPGQREDIWGDAGLVNS